MYTLKEIESGIGEIQNCRSTKVIEYQNGNDRRFDTFEPNESPTTEEKYFVRGYIRDGKYYDV